jgi:hypothetical protein
MRTHKRLVSVSGDGPFADVQFGCGYVTISREDDKIILTAGPGCNLDDYDFVEINVVADHGPGYVRRAKSPQQSL